MKRRLLGRLRRVIEAWFAGRFSEIAAGIAELRAENEELRSRLGEQQDEIERLRQFEARSGEHDAAIAELTGENTRLRQDFDRLAPAVASHEERLADAKAGRLDDERAAGGGAELGRVATEHQRIRARMQVISEFEERLRRLEVQAVGPSEH